MPYASNSGVREGLTGGGDALVAGFEKMGGPISDAYAARLFTPDPKDRSPARRGAFCGRGRVGNGQICRDGPNPAAAQ